MTAKEKSTAPDPWQSFLGKLSPAAKHGVQQLPTETPVCDEETSDYSSFRKRLSESGRERLDQLVPSEPVPIEVEPAEEAHRYYAVETADGEWPVLKGYHTIEELTKHIASLEGQDIVVMAFHGVYLPFTEGNPRYLFLADGAHAIEVTERAKPHLVESEFLQELEVQSDGFLGPDHLCHSQGITRPVVVKHKRKARDDDDDDDEDDEEEDAMT